MHRKATKLIKIWISIPPVTCLTITAVFSFPSLLAGKGQSRSAVLAPARCSNQALLSKTVQLSQRVQLPQRKRWGREYSSSSEERSSSQ